MVPRKKSGASPEFLKKCPNCHNMTLRKNGHNPGNKAQRWICRASTGTRTYCYSTQHPNKPKQGKNAEPDKVLVFNPENKSKVLFFSWAQNATPVHKGFLGAAKAFQKDTNAEIRIQTGRYRNPTSFWPDSQINAQWWAPELVPYLVNQRKALNKNLMLLADVTLVATAQHPLRGLEAFTRGESSIVGHPKLALRVVATPNQKLPKIMMTTGAITVPNYTDSGAGKKGEESHNLGAIIIEIVDDRTFHYHDVSARADGAFCWLDKAYYPDGTVGPAGAYELLSFGDAHPDFADPAVVSATFDKGGLVEKLNPKKLAFHDLLDSYAVNPHHEGNPFIAFAKQESGKDNMEAEVQRTIDWLIKYSEGREAFIVPSNHDDMFTRWIKSTDWRSDPVNAKFYIKTVDYMLDGTVMTKNGVYTPDPFHYWVKKRNQKNIHCISGIENLTVASWLSSLHGHQGPNGARGSILNLSKLGTKVISGHGHSPAIEGGHRRNGTMTYLRLEYTGPISDWLNAHTSVDPMKKAHTHICIDGKFWM